MKKAEIFERFLKGNDLYIDFNGINYTLVQKDNKPLMVFDSPKEILCYIIGFNLATSKLNEVIKELEEENKTNVDRYEDIINSLSTNGSNE